MRSSVVSIFILAIGVLSTSCMKKSDYNGSGVNGGIQETAANQIGEVMASIDENGGASGTFAMLQGERKVFARMAPSEFKNSITLSSLLLPKAQATSLPGCSLANMWGNCTNNRLVRTFNNCSMGGSAIFAGAVTLDFDDGVVDNICTMDSDGDSIARNPDFTITGPLGGTYKVSKTGSFGQKITRIAPNTFAFSNDGIKRTVTFRGTVFADFTTVTTSDIGITGVNRNGRVVNGGTLRVQNNITGVSCDFSPSNLTWVSSCNCPTSGQWAGACSDGKSGTLAITGCGTGTFNMNGTPESATFDRCTSI